MFLPTAPFAVLFEIFLTIFFNNSFVGVISLNSFWALFINLFVESIEFLINSILGDLMFVSRACVSSLTSSSSIEEVFLPSSDISCLYFSINKSLFCILLLVSPLRPLGSLILLIISDGVSFVILAPVLFVAVIGNGCSLIFLNIFTTKPPLFNSPYLAITF